MQPRTFAAVSTEDLFRAFLERRDAAIRAEIIERHRPLVRSIAQKFQRPGVSIDDLMQSAWYALIKAVDRFDPSFEAKFSTYATHCVVGEIKRHFRDVTWAFRAPRELQELAGRLVRAQDELCSRLGRDPSIAEVAAHVGASEDELLQAMELQQCYHPVRLDHGEPLVDVAGTGDAEFEKVLNRVLLRKAFRRLDARRRQVLLRRFFHGLSQQEVACELGISQMHVSRLERSALQQLRTALYTNDYPARAA